MLTNFLREIQFRLLTTLLIVLSLTGILASFDLFIKIYSFTFLAVALILLGYLVFSGQAGFTFSISRVTKKFFKKILVLISFVYGGSLVYGFNGILIRW